MNRDHLPTYKHLIHRPRLHDLLNEAINYSVVSITAPPGYGKTLEVSEFCRQTPHHVIWVHCLHLDNDYEHFWHTFKSAVIHEFPDYTDKIKKAKFPPSAKYFDIFISILTSLFETKKLIIVFDNLEYITAAPVLNFINVLITAEQHNLSVILISNQKLSSLLTLGSSKQYYINTSELEFTLNELQQFCKYYKVELLPFELAKTDKYAGGWPLVLHLLFTELKRKGKENYNGAFIWPILSNIFEHNYYNTYPIEVRKILIIFSLLPHAALPLLHDIGLDVEEETVQLLSQIFFIRYDFTKQIYVVHELYRTFLHSKTGLFSQGEICEILSKCSRWYLDNGQVLDALTCYWNIRDYDGYISAIEYMPKKRKDVKTTQTILSRLDRIPYEYRFNNAAYDYCKAFFSLHNMHIQKAKELFLKLLPRLAESENEKTKLGNTLHALADISNLLNTTEGLAYIKEAAAILPDGSQLRTPELLIAENNNVFFLPDNKPGGIERMIVYQAEFASYAVKLTNGSGSGYEFQFAAEACLLSGQFNRASEYAQKAVNKAMHFRQYDIFCNALFLQVRVCLLSGDLTAALDYYQKIRDCALKQNNTIVSNIHDFARYFLYIYIGYADRKSEELPQQIEQTDIPLENAGRINIIIACYYLQNEYYAKALSRIIELEELFPEKKMWVTSIYAHLCRAFCYLNTNQPDLAIEHLWKTYLQTYENDLWVIYAEFGTHMIPLLHAAEKQTRYCFNPHWISKLRKKCTAHTQRIYAMQKTVRNKKPIKYIRKSMLTKREKEVLNYMADGLTQKEIAAALGISVHGVKKHTSNIYTKLGAANRIDALYIAMSNDILPQSHDFVL